MVKKKLKSGYALLVEIVAYEKCQILLNSFYGEFFFFFFGTMANSYLSIDKRKANKLFGLMSILISDG